MLASLLAACGSFTRRDYELRAEGICDATIRSLRLLRPPGVDGSVGARIADMAEYLDRALPLERRELSELRALPEPNETRAQARALARYLDAFEVSVDEVGALAAAARAGNAQMFAAAERTLARSRLAKLAAASGLRVCSNSAVSYT